MSFPDKKNRLNCWENRDKYWQCLDLNGSEDMCKEFRKNYEIFCPALWVKHFDKKRGYLEFKERLEKEGYVPEFPENPRKY